MEDKIIINDSPFRNEALKHTFTVSIISMHLGMSVLKYSGLSVSDVQEFLILVNSDCTLSITCDS